jgi:flagellar biosynthetic protein FliQ
MRRCKTLITLADINQIVASALMMVIRMSLPILLTSMVIGLIVSIFQTVTSIQEQTLTFVPKVLGVFIMIMILGNWMLTELSGFIINLWSDFSKYVR